MTQNKKILINFKNHQNCRIFVIHLRITKKMEEDDDSENENDSVTP